MPVKIFLHPVLREKLNDGPFETAGKTVGECLDGLIGLYPALEKKLYEKKEKLKPWIEIYVNDRCAHPEELSCLVRDGDEIRVALLLCMGG